MVNIPFFRNGTDDSPTEVPLDDTFHKQFWSQFRRHLSEQNCSLQPYGRHRRNAHCDIDREVRYSYFGCFFGDFHVRYENLWLIGWIWPSEGQISAKLSIENEQVFNKLIADKDSIETRFNQGELEWHDPPTYSVGIYKFVETSDFTVEANWQGLFEWLRINLERIEKVFMNKLALYYIEEQS